MVKILKNPFILLACILYFGSVYLSFAAPVSNLMRNVLPETTQTYDIGSTTPAAEWKNIYTQNITVSGTCTGCTTLTGGTAGMLTSWLTSSTLTATSTPSVSHLIATSSTASILTGGFLSYASSTLKDFTGLNATTTTATTTNLAVTSVTSALVITGSGGALAEYAGSSNPCTNQLPTTLTALGVLGGCTSVSNDMLTNSSLTVTAGSGLIGGGTVSLGGTITLTAQVGTSTVPTLGHLAYWTDDRTPSLLGSVATTSVTCSGLVSCTGFTALGSASTITTTATSTNYWYANGNDIYKNNSGNVGIGTTTPSNLLSVMGSGYISSGLFVGGAITATSTLTVGGKIVIGDRFPMFSMSSSTAFAQAGGATTTISVAVAPSNMTYNYAQCYFDSFLAISFRDLAGNRMEYFIASSTVGTTTLATNNFYFKGEPRFVDVGTTTNVSRVTGGCTANATLN